MTLPRLERHEAEPAARPPARHYPAHVDNPFHFSFRAPESLPNPLLRMEKVSAGYGDRVILDSIKLNLVPGSRIGLLGRNGAGKSTLIKLLAEELKPLLGDIGMFCWCVRTSPRAGWIGNTWKSVGSSATARLQWCWASAMAGRR